MIFENDDWKFVLTPRYVRKNKSKVLVTCPHCRGSGLILAEKFVYGVEGSVGKCGYCTGSGWVERLVDIPEPPEIDERFLQDLQDWMNKYSQEKG